MTIFQVRLSKFLSYVLRHAPGEYDLVLDKNGCADLDKVLEVLKRRFRVFREDDLFDLVKNDPKGRFEIADKKIRATYGHSVEVTPKAESVTPPDVLYHGTSKEHADEIMRDGLKPMGRQFVHLSLNEEDAHAVGLRHTEDPVMLKIIAKEASLNGVRFFKEKSVVLVEYVPRDYIKMA